MRFLGMRPPGMRSPDPRPVSRPWAALAVLALLWPVALAAQEPAARPLTLDDAIATALEGSDLLSAAEAGVAAAEAGLGEARAARLPTVEITEMAHRTTNPVLVFSDLLGQEAFTERNFAIDPLNEPDPLNNFNTRLSVSLPLWTGGRIAGAVEAAGFGREAAAADRTRTRQEVIHQVIDAYTGAVAARRRLGVAREALETARAHAELVRDLREGGLVVESDLLSAQVRVQELQEGVVRARQGVAVSEAALNLAMGVDLGTGWTLPEDLEAAAGPRGEAPSDESLKSLVAEARERRPDLAAARARVAAAESLAQMARAERMPEVGLSGSYDANAEDFIGADGTNWTVGVGVRFTLFDGFATRSRVEKARQEAVRAARLTHFAGERAALEVRQAYYDLQTARESLELAAKARELAERSLTIVEDRYREGLTTLVELLDAQTALTDARSREVSSHRDLLRARAGLDLAVGRR